MALGYGKNGGLVPTEKFRKRRGKKKVQKNSGEKDEGRGGGGVCTNAGGKAKSLMQKSGKQEWVKGKWKIGGKNQKASINDLMMDDEQVIKKITAEKRQ